MRRASNPSDKSEPYRLVVRFPGWYVSGIKVGKGVIVGDDVGGTDGDDVGAGDMVGLLVVGEEDGNLVGSTEGKDVGNCVGSADGVNVGDSVGNIEGCEVDGELLGILFVGTGLGMVVVGVRGGFPDSPLDSPCPPLLLPNPPIAIATITEVIERKADIKSTPAIRRLVDLSCLFHASDTVSKTMVPN